MLASIAITITITITITATATATATATTTTMPHGGLMNFVFRLTNAEARLAELIWACEPIASMDLVKLADNEFGWKKSTTFSVLKILIEKGVAQNSNSSVTMLCTKEQFITGQSRNYIEDMFGGSLPKFIAAFFGDRQLTAQQAEELRKLIEDYERRDAGNG